MEPSVYGLRTLLGTNAYILFSRPILHAALKQLQVLSSRTRRRSCSTCTTSSGCASRRGRCRRAYRNDARMILEGGDAFQIEQQYADGGGGSCAVPAGGGGGAEGEDGEVEEEDDDDTVDAGEKGEWAAYMASFVHVAAAAAGPKGRKGAVLLSRGARRAQARVGAVLLQGSRPRRRRSCKLRFVSRSEDVCTPTRRAAGTSAARARRPRRRQAAPRRLAAEAAARRRRERLPASRRDAGAAADAQAEGLRARP